MAKTAHPQLLAVNWEIKVVSLIWLFGCLVVYGFMKYVSLYYHSELEAHDKLPLIVLFLFFYAFMLKDLFRKRRKVLDGTYEREITIEQEQKTKERVELLRDEIRKFASRQLEIRFPSDELLRELAESKDINAIEIFSSAGSMSPLVACQVTERGIEINLVPKYKTPPEATPLGPETTGA